MTNPQAVSRALHRAGIQTVPDRRREGVYCTKSWRSVTVVVQIDQPSWRRELTALVSAALRDDGYSVEPHGGDDAPHILAITRPKEH